MEDWTSHTHGLSISKWSSVMLPPTHRTICLSNATFAVQHCNLSFIFVRWTFSFLAWLIFTRCSVGCFIRPTVVTSHFTREQINPQNLDLHRNLAVVSTSLSLRIITTLKCCVANFVTNRDAVWNYVGLRVLFFFTVGQRSFYQQNLAFFRQVSSLSWLYMTSSFDLR